MLQPDYDPRQTRILLLRHAETAEPDRFHGAESDVGLGVEGRRQAARIAVPISAVRPSALYSSNLRRALETASPIAQACGLPLRIVHELHERRMGPLSRALRSEAQAIYEETRQRWEAGDLDATHEGGESFAQIRARVLPAVQGLVADHLGESIVVVAHGVVIRVLLTSLLDGYSPADFERIAIRFVAINDLRFDGQRWWVEALDQRPEAI